MFVAVLEIAESHLENSKPSNQSQWELKNHTVIMEASLAGWFCQQLTNILAPDDYMVRNH